MALERIFKWLFLTTGIYAAMCAPAILLAERFGFRESPIHVTQWLAAAACIPASSTYLWLSRARPTGPLRLLAILALVSALAWVAFVIYVIKTLDFSAMDP